MNVSIVLLLGAALMGTCMGRFVKHPPSLRIDDGTEAVPHSIPYQAYVFFVHPSGKIGEFCGAILISENYVLTTATCASGFHWKSIIVGLGAHDRANDSESTREFITSYFEQVIIHENFNYDNASNNIALIKLTQPANVTSAVNFVEISSLTDEELVGKNATVSGWGLTSAAGGQLTDNLRVVNVTIAEDSVCESLGAYNKDQEICTAGTSPGSVVEGPCAGDVGGPLTVEGKLVGMVSYFPEHCEGRILYTRMTNYVEWIKAHSDVHLD